MPTFVLVAVMLSVVNGRQAQVTTSASTVAVHPGEKITLSLEVELRPGVHAYAPGVENYIPISWTLEKSRTYSANDVEVPPARMLHLDAIDETVPVYEGHFRLVREVTIGPRRTVRKGPLNIAGTLRYQACDDRMCYKPETLPLQWTLTVNK